MQVVVGTGRGPGDRNYVNSIGWLHSKRRLLIMPMDGNPAGVFESSLDPIIVGQGAYNSAYGTTFAGRHHRNGVARIADFSMEFNTLLTGQRCGQHR